MENVTEYVVGFAFDYSMSNVLLIVKDHPAWQAGKMNGIGGKIEPGEQPIAAMSREADEEAGLGGITWFDFCELSGPGFKVHFFYTTCELAKAAQKESERLEIVDCNSVATHAVLTIPNLAWLIPMAKSLQRGERASFFVVEEFHGPDE